MRRITSTVRAVAAIAVTLGVVAVAMPAGTALTSTPMRTASAVTDAHAATSQRLTAADAFRTDIGTDPNALTSTQRAAVNGSALVGDPAAYARVKAGAARRVASRSRGIVAGSSSLAPTTVRSFQGQNELGAAPSDSTGAIGTQRFVELVNSKIGIYDRTHDTPIASDSLNTLTGAGAGPEVFDPQVIWDPDTTRFYYAMDVVVDARDNFLAFGFSKTATPNNATADWCQYAVSFGAEFPDYPKLGDLSGLALIGVNVFNGTAFTRSDVVAVTKPGAGTTCPPATALTVSIARDLRNADGSQSTTPVPVNQVDGNTTGHVVAGKGFAGGNFISVFSATENASAQLVLGAARAMPVAAFAVPPAAPQPGTTKKLDTLDARLTNAVEAIDPGHANHVAIWTQHTVAGGAGSEVRWYEIDPSPVTPVPFQSGTEGDGSLFLFNAAISPDRRRNGAAGQFGNGMLLQFSRSSSNAKVTIAAVSKVGTGAVTGANVLLTSSDVIDDFSCDATNICRWGDYAGASPDPASDTTVANGVVWAENAWAQASAGSNADWRTQAFALRVSPK